jgi:hypothetical protein
MEMTEGSHNKGKSGLSMSARDGAHSVHLQSVIKDESDEGFGGNRLPGTAANDWAVVSRYKMTISSSLASN